MKIVQKLHTKVKSSDKANVNRLSSFNEDILVLVNRQMLL